MGNEVYSLKHLPLLINVVQDVKGETYDAEMYSKDNNWALLDINLVAKHYLYCDSLTWPIPSQIEYHLMPVLEALRSYASATSTYLPEEIKVFYTNSHVSESANDVGKHY